MSLNKLSVSVIGLGKMGAALANAFHKHEQVELTVWNRDTTKSSIFKNTDTTISKTVVDAISASPIIIVCVSDYEAVKAIFNNEEVIKAIQNKIIVQLSTGIPLEAFEFAKWIGKYGSHYIDGKIAAWTNQIGKPEASIMVGGEEAVYEKASVVLKILAGNIIYMGNDVRKPAATFSALLSYLAGHWLGLSFGAAICEKEGLDLISYGTMLNDIAPFLGMESKYLTEVIAKNDFSNAESTIKTSGADISRLVRQANEYGINDEFPKFASSIFQKTIDAGYGEEEHSALIKVMR
jgi:3-hydroxyisobutyrate dehydrogenase-like beta-hydroxyacid dehydrogenase